MSVLPALADQVGACAGPITQSAARAVRAAAGDRWCDLSFVKTRSPAGDFVVRFPDGLGASEADAVVTAVGSRPEVSRTSVVDNRLFLRVSDAAVVDAVHSQEWGLPFPDRGAQGRRLAFAFSNPNSNKPLHLGHFRQNVIGMALHRLFLAAGFDSVAASLSGDWGIHIAQALVGYEELSAADRDAARSGKPDHVAGASIAAFYKQAQSRPTLEDQANQLLVRLHAGDPEALERCRRFTIAARAGQGATHRAIGSVFDYEYGEDDVLPRAMALVRAGCASGLFRERPDKSIAVDLGEEDMWNVTLVRGNGTTTCYPQHLAGWDQLHDEFRPDAVLILLGPDLIPTAGVWRAMANRLRLPLADRFFPFYHGLVRSSAGRLRSRYGQSLTIDSVLDDVAAQWPVWQRTAATNGSSAAAWAPGEQAAALLKYLFLHVPRMKDVTYDEGKLWTATAPRFARISHSLELARQAALPTCSRTDAEEPLSDAVRDLALCLDDLPVAAERSLAELDPVFLVRYADKLAGAIGAAHSASGTWPMLWGHAARTLEASLRLLNLAPS